LEREPVHLGHAQVNHDAGGRYGLEACQEGFSAEEAPDVHVLGAQEDFEGVSDGVVVVDDVDGRASPASGRWIKNRRERASASSSSRRPPSSTTEERASASAGSLKRSLP